MAGKNINPPTAIFIDGDWIFATTRRINKNIDYAKFFDTLVKKFGVKTKIYYYGAIDSKNKQQEKFYISLKKIGYIVNCINVKKINNKIISRDLDVNLTVGAMRILPLLRNFILISGDSDFAPLLQHARQTGVNTSIIALPLSTGYLLRRVADNFFNLETLIIDYKLKTTKKRVKVEKSTAQTYIEKGDYYKSYIRIRDLMKSAKKNITIIDQYIDDQMLAMIQLLNNKINITIITYNTSPADFLTQVKKLKKEGYSIDIYKTKIFHDRFIGIDGVWWHSGYSFKDLGERDSMLNKITEKNAQLKLNNRVTKVINKSKL
ncbi:MAG: NYN domain-containing protein [Candidatus Paceibacterota bacterium]|jgi:uncharacterized LabA/DUF88 family protein